MNRKNKRYFQLLEVLIALFLVATCALPVMGSYVYIYKEHKSMQQKIDIDHLVHLAHAKIIEDIYKKGSEGVPIREFINKEMSIPVQELNPESSLSYDMAYKFTILLPKPGKRSEKAHRTLLNLEIQPRMRGLSTNDPHHSYTYLVAVKLDYKEGQDNGLPPEYKESKGKKSKSDSPVPTPTSNENDDQESSPEVNNDD